MTNAREYFRPTSTLSKQAMSVITISVLPAGSSPSVVLSGQDSVDNLWSAPSAVEGSKMGWLQAKVKGFFREPMNEALYSKVAVRIVVLSSDTDERKAIEASWRAFVVDEIGMQAEEEID